MADASATYTLNWSGNFAEGAGQATSAAEAMAASLKQLRTAGGQGLSQLGNAARGVAPALAQAGNAVKAAGAGAGGASLNIRALGRVFRSTGGEMGSLAGHGVQLAGALGRLIASPVGIAAAVVVLTVAVIAAAAAFAHWAITSANAARAHGLLMQAATGSVAGAAALEAQVSQLGNVTGLSAAKLREMGLELARSGLSGAALASTFDAAAIAASAMGEAAGSKIKGIGEEAVKSKRFMANAMTLQGTGVGLDDVAAALAGKLHVSLATAKNALQSGTVQVQAGLDALDDAVRSKLGGIAKAQSIDLDVQLARLSANIGSLFKGLNIDPFLEGLHDVLSVFDQSTVSGKGLAAAMKGIAGPLLDGLTTLMPLGKLFFQGMIIAALEVAIVVLKLRNYFRDTFKGVGASVDTATIAITAGKVALYSIAIVFGLIGAAVALLVGTIGVLVTAFVGPVVAIGYGIYKLYGIIKGALGAAIDYLSGLDFGSIATNLVMGLVNGIENGVSWVVDAVKGLGAAAMNALTSKLVMHSPSQVFAQYGAFTAQGFAQGVEDETPAVRRSVASMVDTPPDLKGAGAGGGRSLVVSGNTIEIHGIKGAEELQSDDFFSKLALAIEKLGGEGGADLLAPEGTS